MRVGTALTLTGVIAVVAATSPLPVHAQSGAVGAVEVNDKVISISGHRQQRTLPCNGRKLEVMGSDHVITTTGECSHVDVSGAGNTVNTALRTGGTLEVAGSSHQVNWKADGEVKQDITGYDHKIVRTK